MSKSVTTSTGTTISTRQSEDNLLVVMDHPQAPADMRNNEVGRIMTGPRNYPLTQAQWYALARETVKADK